MTADLEIGRSAMAIEDQAAEWSAIRRASDTWTDEQQVQLDTWLSQSAAHRVAYLRIEATWRRTERLAALRDPLPMRASIKPSRSKTAILTRIAAALSLVVLTGVFASYYLFADQRQLIETPKGALERLTLADGSRIELNTDSAIRVNLHSQVRAVELLRGEAFFEIKHDSAHPFVVTASGHRIVDLGTKFLVRVAPQALRVALIEGSARFEKANAPYSQAGVNLRPGDVAVATASGTHISRKSERDLAESLAWQRGVIVFRNAQLAEAAGEFNRYGGPQLVVADSAAAKLKVNGTFLTTGGEDFANVARELFGLHVEHRNGSIVLTKQ